MRTKHRTNDLYAKLLTIVSNGAFLFPLYLLVSQERYTLALIVGVILIISSTYHIFKPAGVDSPWLPKKRTTKHKLLLWTDVLVTLSFGIYVFFFHLLPVIPRTDSIQHEIALILFLMGFLVYAFPSQNYEQRHSLWHILAATALYLVFI